LPAELSRSSHQVKTSYVSLSPLMACHRPLSHGK
jgi:hypothetical protein